MPPPARSLRSSRSRLAWSCVLWLCCLPFVAVAAPSSAADVAARIAEVERRPASDPTRDALLQILQQTKSFLDAQAASVEEAEKHAKSLVTGPSSIKQLNAELAQLNAEAATPPVTAAEMRLSLADLQQVLEAAVTQRAALETRLGGYELHDRTLQARPAEIVQDKSRILARLGEIEVELSAPDIGSGGEQPGARRQLLEAESAARQAELDALSQEQLSHGLRLELNATRRKLAEAGLARATQRVGALEQLMLDKRQEELRRIQDEALQAQRDTAGSPPLIRQLAADNAQLGTALSQVLDEQSRKIRERTGYSEQRQRLDAEFDRARQRVEIAGASSSLGRLLVEQRRQIPALRSLRRLAKLNDGEVSRVGMARIEIEEQLRETLESDDPLRALSASLEAPGAALNPDEERQARTLLDDRLELLRTLDENYASYLRMLDAAGFELQQMTSTVAAYRAFLDERLLWLPNAPPLSLAFFSDVVTGAQWFLSPSNWTQTRHDVVAGASRAWPRLLLAVFVIAALARARPRLRPYLVRLADAVGNPQEDRLRNTLMALVVTTLVALPESLALWLVADLLTAGYASGEFSIALGQLSAKAAELLFAVNWVRIFLGRNGVALRHFRWAPDGVERARRQWLRWGQLFVPSYAIATVFEWSSNPAFQYSLRRLFFLLAMIAAAAFSHWLTKRSGMLHYRLALNHPTSWITRSRPVWGPAATWAPIVLALLSASGYHYTALELSGYYLDTVLLLFATTILYQLALRLLSIAQQRIALKKATAPPADPDAPPAEDEPVTDFATMNAQARLILANLAGWSVAIALFWVWHDVLPALTVFDQVTLWQIEVKDAAGATQLAPITIANAAVAAVMLGITLLAARNVPGILEIVLLQRLGIHRGSRYAVTTLAQYFIVAFGITLAFGTLGLRWSQVQWLIAALGVGLGFGLQEIFANFISGLILLFERPIRVGDMVTMGELSGRVSRIQIRATTICDADNREIIVPNKNFITERFVNWTLSDQVTRVLFQVRVAYGSDIARVRALLLDVARAHPKALKEPAPAASFVGFGDSALNFELQVYARELVDRGDIRHEINTRIYETFAAAGIEIPLPQRDLNLKSLPPGFCPPPPPA